MGCFNTTGFISRLPIVHGDRVVCFIGILNHQSARELYYPDALVSPYFLPIRGHYNDYGSIKRVDRTPIVEMIERVAGQDIEELCRGIERCLYGRTIQDNIDHWNSIPKERSMYEKLTEFFQRPYICSDGTGVEPVLLFEHEDIYDKLFPIQGFDGEWRLNEISSYVHELEGLYNKNKERIDEDEKVLVTMTQSIPSLVQTGEFSRPIDFSYVNAIEISNQMREIWENTCFTELPYVMMGANWITFSMYSKLTLQERFTVYKECIDEVKRMVAMWYFYLHAPMYIGFSKTAGEQDFKLKNFELLNKVIFDKIEEMQSFEDE